VQLHRPCGVALILGETPLSLRTFLSCRVSISRNLHRLIPGGLAAARPLRPTQLCVVLRDFDSAFDYRRRPVHRRLNRRIRGRRMRSNQASICRDIGFYSSESLRPDPVQLGSYGCTQPRSFADLNVSIRGSARYSVLGLSLLLQCPLPTLQCPVPLQPAPSWSSRSTPSRVESAPPTLPLFRSNSVLDRKSKLPEMLKPTHCHHPTLSQAVATPAPS
jgi:hypothetical protein